MSNTSLNVLLIGSGGREHAIAWKLAQSPRLQRLYIAPGNPGTAAHGENVAIRADDRAGLVGFALQHDIHLAIIGPEGPLAIGLADDLRAAGVLVFGPDQAAAQIEASKSFAKDFMQRHHIPTARYAVFTELEPALAHLQAVSYPIVIKASGLAAGKGVYLPETAAEAAGVLRSMLAHNELGAAGLEVVIEERLSGEEVSLLAFTDGISVRTMPPAQDHKRLLDGDRGPNTGGMGAYAPAPVCPPALAARLERSVLQTTVDGLRLEGRPFVGVLYAGLILTPDGPYVLEFNCRFGDPETQALLPLLESDLLEISAACAAGRLADVEIEWKNAAAACVVLAADGYPATPATGQPIHGLEHDLPNTFVFHAGTSSPPFREGAGVGAPPPPELVTKPGLGVGVPVDSTPPLTAGGRVLAVTAWAPDLARAIERAYQRVHTIHFANQHYRRDIGRAALRREAAASDRGAALEPHPAAPSAYAAAGVSIDAGSQAVAQMSAAVKATYGPEVLAGIGAFGGLYDASAIKGMSEPVLVASTDGVGTKVKLAAHFGRYASIGHDIVNHCINDILVQGARPLFFLDYFATARLDPAIAAEVVGGIAAACQAAGCALLGGETAEMPGVYQSGEFDVAGTIVGLADKGRLLPRPDIAPGDRLIGLRSSGPHTNGYSLIRRIFSQPSALATAEAFDAELGASLADALLAPHRSYFNLLWPIMQRPDSPIKGLAHLTGGGFIENIPRILPDHCGATVWPGAWPVPPLFARLQQLGQVSQEEMHRVFNMGIGMVVVVAAAQAEVLQAELGEESWQIGEVVAGSGIQLLPLAGAAR